MRSTTSPAGFARFGSGDGRARSSARRRSRASASARFAAIVARMPSSMGGAAGGGASARSGRGASAPSGRGASAPRPDRSPAMPRWTSASARSLKASPLWPLTCWSATPPARRDRSAAKRVWHVRARSTFLCARYVPAVMFAAYVES